MHVLEVIHGLAPGGAESALMRRLRFAPPGVHTTVLATTPVAAEQAAELEELSVPLVSRTLGWRDASWLRRAVSSVGADVVVSHSPGETIKLLAWQQKSSVPLVVVAHHGVVSDDPRNQWLKERAFRLLNNRADLHIAVSTPAARGAQCVGARRVEVHMLGADLAPGAVVDSAWPPEARMRLMTLSRLIRFKNVTAMVEAVGMQSALMRAVGAHLAVVGSGPMHDEITAAVERLALRDLVSLVGYVPNPAALLGRADVLVNCSTSEGGPLTVFEACLAGARVLSTPTGVAPDVLADDAGSVITAGSSAPELAAGLKRALELGPVGDVERLRRAAAATRWQAARCAPGYYDLLTSVVT